MTQNRTHTCNELRLEHVLNEALRKTPFFFHPKTDFIVDTPQKFLYNTICLPHGRPKEVNCGEGKQKNPPAVE